MAATTAQTAASVTAVTPKCVLCHRQEEGTNGQSRVRWSAMLEITRTTDYAVRILAGLYCATGERTKAADLATATGVSEKYVLKVLATLKRRGWVVSHRGTAGGYSLVSQAKEITLLQVVELFEGPVHLNACTGPNGCQFVQRCPAHNVWLEAETELRRILTKYNVAELGARSQPQGLFVPAQRE